ncbi:hypothetical protein D9M73_206050 [compost metagenome]
MHRQVQLATGPIPQRLLDQRQGTVGQLAGATALPVREVVPDFFAVKGIGANQHLAHEIIQHIRANELGCAQRIAFAAALGPDAQQGHPGLGHITWVGMAGAVYGAARGVGKYLDGYSSNDHGRLSLLIGFVASESRSGGHPTSSYNI